jgi:hypothetical protein
MTDHNADYDAHGRPSTERDGACICDYNPSSTDGPQEDCPFHGRPYVYWIERGDALAERLRAVETLLDEWEAAHSHLGIERGNWGPSSSRLRAALRVIPPAGGEA